MRNPGRRYTEPVAEDALINAGCLSVLIVASPHVGNNIFCTPAIRLLKRTRPQVHIDVLCTRRRGADTFRGNPDVGTTHVVWTRWGLRRIAARYDVVLGMYRDGLGANVSRLRVCNATIDADRGIHRADHRLEFMQRLTGGVTQPEDRSYVVRSDERERSLVQSALRSAGQGDQLVGLHLGCGRTSTHGWKFWYGGRDQAPKLWPLERYIELSHGLQNAVPGVRLVITGSAQERFLARRFVSAVPGTVDLVGQTSIGSVAALMSSLRLFITHDTGVLHVACATGVPLIGLYGPTRVKSTGPYPGASHRTVIRGKTMAHITPHEVCEAAIALLAKGTVERPVPA